MDSISQQSPSEEVTQTNRNSELPQSPTRKKLNWKGFFIAIIIVIIIEIFAVTALKSDTKQTANTRPTPVPVNAQTKKTQMIGIFIWNVPSHSISTAMGKEIKSAFATYNPSDKKTSSADHLSVDGITISTTSADFASAKLTVRIKDNSILPTDGIEYYLHRTNGQWQIITGGDRNFCQEMKIFPKDLLDDVSYYQYYGCPK